MKKILIPKDKRCPIGDINVSWCTIKCNKFYIRNIEIFIIKAKKTKFSYNYSKIKNALGTILLH